MHMDRSDWVIVWGGSGRGGGAYFLHTCHTVVFRTLRRRGKGNLKYVSPNIMSCQDTSKARDYSIYRSEGDVMPGNHTVNWQHLKVNQ